MQRRIVVGASLIAVAAVALALAIFPTLYHGSTTVLPQTSTSATGTNSVLTGQCQKADANAKYPLFLELRNPSGDLIKGAWIILLDWDRGIPFEENYSRDDGTYISKHTYSPLQTMTILIQNDRTVAGFQNYVVEIWIPDLVCSDGYIHVQVNAS